VTDLHYDRAPIQDEIREIAEQIAAGPGDVADLGAEITAWYRRHRQNALDLAGISAFLADGEEIDESHPFLVDGRRQLRDRSRKLLTWARETGRMGNCAGEDATRDDPRR
jgi:hypothetical protein